MEDSNTGDSGNPQPWVLPVQHPRAVQSKNGEEFGDEILQLISPLQHCCISKSFWCHANNSLRRLTGRFIVR